MSSIGINFRQTAGYVTDGAGETYCLGEAYPVTREGWTFGFSTDSTAQTRNRNTSVDRRFAGVFFVANNVAKRTFLLDLPGAGTYRVRAAFGDSAFAQSTRAEIKDGAVVKSSVNSYVQTGFMLDATGASLTFDGWVLSNASIDVTFTGTQLSIDLGEHAESTSASVIAHLYVEQLAPAGDPPLGTVTLGTITPGETTASVAYTYNDTDQTGFESRLNAGAAASIGASPATITGLTASTTYDIEVRAINANGAGAWSAVGSFTTTAPTPNTAPTFDGPDIANISGTEAVALTPLDVSALFSDAESGLTFSAVGAWPAGVTVSSAGVISGTPTTAGTYASLQVRATDTGALTADSNTFTITVAAAPAINTITVTEPLTNNTGTLLANASGIRVAVLQAADMVSVHEDTGLTTNASGVLAAISDVAIVSGTSYHVAIKLADGSVGITGPITAS